MPLTIEDEILVLCARTEIDQVAQTRLTELVCQGEVDWERLASRALLHRVNACLYRHLVEEPKVSVDLPDQFKVELARRVAIVRQENELKRWAAKLLWEASDERGIAPIALKGLDLVHSIYPPSWLRSYRDLDFLLVDEEVETFRDILEGLGFQRGRWIAEHNLVVPITPEEDEARAKSGRPHSDFPYFLPTPELPGYSIAVELHYSICDEIRFHQIPTEELASACQREVIDGVSQYYLTPCDLLVTLYVFVFNDYSSIEIMKSGEDFFLRSFADLREILVWHSDSIDWGRFLDSVRSWHLEYPVYQMNYFVEELYGEQMLPEMVRNEITLPGFVDKRLAIHDTRCMPIDPAEKVIGYWETDFRSVFSREDRYYYSLERLFFNCINTYYHPIRKRKQEGNFPRPSWR